MEFAGDLESFAERQGKTQAEQESALFGSAKAALRHYGQDGWYDALLARAESVLRHRYRQETSTRTSPALREFVDAYHAAMAKWLEKTTEPTPDTLEGQARSIAATLSTAAVNAALDAAAEDDDTPNEELERVWLSREDEKVRPTHAAAHGQTAPMGGKFTVGEAQLSRPGDPSGPIGEVINCRCLLAVRKVERADAVTASVATEEAEATGVGIFLLIDDNHPIHDVVVTAEPHMTTVWLGNQGDDFAGDIEAIQSALAEAAGSLEPVDATITERGTLGDDDADVVFFDSQSLTDLRSVLLGYPAIKDAMDAVEQFPEWNQHVTLGYPDDPPADDAADLNGSTTMTFDRLALWVGPDHYEYPLGADMENDTTTEDQAAGAPEPLAEGDRLEAVDGPIPFWGIMAPEATMSGDGRMFDDGALRARPLPLPLAFQRSNEMGHDSSVKVGNYERVWRRDGKVYGMGHFLTVVPEVDEMVGMMAESGGRMGVSIDADDGTMEMRLKDGRTLEQAMDELQPETDDYEGDSIDFEDIITAFTSARICGATGVHIPAFHEAFIALGDVPEEFAPKDGEDVAIESLAEQEAAAAAAELAALAAAGAKTEDGPGWITHPVDTDRLRDYWTKGEGAAKINWGTPGDFNRCRAALAAYVKPQHLSGYCANRHYDALGFWPGRPLAADVLTAAAWADAAPEGATMAPAISLVAAANLATPPAEWFEDPALVGPTHLTITDEGRVFGHLATWGTCHIGFKDICTEPPQSGSDYAYFRTGLTLTTGGEVATGVITMDTGHAGLRDSASVAAAHYDNTGAAVMDVAAGEDEHGIWVAGAIRTGIDDDRLRAMRAMDVSGDWRNIKGSLELVGVLGVNVPGFPVPRTALAASAGHQTALVAAGVVHRKEPVTQRTINEMVEQAIRERDERIAAKAQLDALAGARAKAALDTIRTTRERTHA